MELATLPFPFNVLSPPGARPLVREPNARWARGMARPTLVRLTVVEVIEETPSTRTFVLGGDDLAYLPGQHLTVVAELGGRSVRRCYSFSSSPVTGGRPSITVKRVEGGDLSNWLHDHVRVGDVLRSTAVSGRFTVEVDAHASRHIGLVAGGVGITPIISMAESVLRGERNSQVTLLYGSRSQSELIFHKRIEALEQEFQNRFHVLLTVDLASSGWTAGVGPINSELVRSAMAENEIGEWFICGPTPMMNSVVETLEQAGVADERIHLERFEYAEAGKVAMPTKPATLVFAKSERTVPAPVGTTILDAAEAAGIAIPSSCRMGGCGACKVKVEGSVVTAQPNCLTDQEKADNYALACCSWGDGRVVLSDY